MTAYGENLMATHSDQPFIVTNVTSCENGAPLGRPGIRRLRGNPAELAYTCGSVSIDREDIREGQHLELPVEELLRRARPLPPHDEMVIEDLSQEEGAAFLAAVRS